MFKHLFVSESSCPCCLQAALIEEAQGSAAKDAAMKLRHGRFNCLSTAFPRPFRCPSVRAVSFNNNDIRHFDTDPPWPALQVNLLH